MYVQHHVTPDPMAAVRGWVLYNVQVVEGPCMRQAAMFMGERPKVDILELMATYRQC